MGFTDTLGDIVDGGKSLANDGLGALEEGWEKGKRGVGEFVDWGTNHTGRALDAVGAEGAADAVEDWGDDAAASLGATVGEQQLGQTEEANELVHGSPSDIRSSAKHLRDFQKAFDLVGKGMRKLDSSHWKGEAAEAFRDTFPMHPVKWMRASDACEKAAAALESFADTVGWAQREAKRAVTEYKKGEAASKKARGEDPPPDKDPGDTHREAAEEILARARDQRNEAARSAAKSVREALVHAPKEPPPLSRATATYVDGMQAGAIELTHVAGGVIKGGAGLVNFARGLNPLDVYNLTHPAAYAQNVNTTLAGLVSTAAHPERIPQALVDSFKKDPSEGVGRLIPELLGTKGLGAARTGARVAAKEGAEAARYGAPAGAEGAEAAARTGAREASGAGRDWGDLAQSTERVQERAIHYDSVDPAKAQEFLDDQFPWMRDLNNRWEPGYTHNCPNNVVTVDRRLDGHEVSAAPLHGGGDMPNSALGSGHPDGFKYYMNSYDDIIRDMEQRGPDARGAVSIRRDDGTGHLFNVINTPHGVAFLDGQTGTLARLEQDVIRIGYMPYRS
ncbi:hypothetical protein JW613_13600 [Streptomyces smyrnaeus]|uniref:Tox-PL domain-containing protein n=1 Tax=Streptomyces smyrnaeus TaxID=1387713 RepID=A0ABS3XW77_9ACTN|nr:toxin glutamine deamidase domain-containing protein [Streptomyces smyrnaeus]MBO8199326.1 hypothetical protein [Streptomyces smyrnaeus]